MAKHVATGAWFRYSQHQITFAICGSVYNAGLKEYVGKKGSDGDKAERMKDADAADTNFRELLFCHVVDNFKTFLVELILQVLEKEPRPIFGKKTDLKLIFESIDIEELRKDVIERVVADLSYSNMEDLVHFLESHFGLKSLSESLTIRRLNRYVQIRNIITHNRGVVNKIFLERSGSKRDLFGQKVFVPHPIRAGRYLYNLVRKLDQEAATKFSLTPALPGK